MYKWQSLITGNQYFMTRSNLKTDVWKNIDIQNDNTVCWKWLLSTNKQGYGYFSYKGKMCKAHRIVFELMNENFNPELKVLHKCDNPPCCNPNHLFAGTQLENIKDKINKNRQAKGVDYKSSKLNNCSVIKIWNLKNVMTAKEVSILFNISDEVVYNIWNRKRWKHVTEKLF